MGWLTTNTCCGCFSVRTGGIILGWFGAISGALAMLFYAMKWDAYLNLLAQQKISPEASFFGGGE